MGDDFDTDLEVLDISDSNSGSDSFDVSSFMDDIPEYTDTYDTLESLENNEPDEGALDVSSVMDATDPFEDLDNWNDTTDQYEVREYFDDPGMEESVTDDSLEDASDITDVDETTEVEEAVSEEFENNEVIESLEDSDFEVENDISVELEDAFSETIEEVASDELEDDLPDETYNDVTETGEEAPAAVTEPSAMMEDSTYNEESIPDEVAEEVTETDDDMLVEMDDVSHAETVEDIPETVDNTPVEAEDIPPVETVENVPETGDDMPAAAEDIPPDETAEDVPETVDNMPVEAEDIPPVETVENVPETDDEMPAAAEDIFPAETAEEVHETVTEVPTDMEETVPVEALEDTEEISSVMEETPPDTSEGNVSAYDAIAEYYSSHNYGRDDYAEYSKDPEWQQLNNEYLQSLGKEPIDYSTETDDSGMPSVTDAQNAMAEYYGSHNYGRDDYAEYSKDPEWQQLNNEYLQSLGEEPIDYSTADVEADALEEAVTEVPEKPERVFDAFEEKVLEDNADFYESGAFYQQGINEYGYSGTCGETTMANTLNHLLETNEFTENKVLNVAVTEGLCDTDSFEDSGGTTTDDFMELYERMNEIGGGKLEVERFDYDNVLTMEEAAAKLDEGCMLNVAVDATTLWNQQDPMGVPELESKYTDHWISVTGVRRDAEGGIEGFDIIDSGGGESYVTADKYQEMCYGSDNVELKDPTCIVVSRKDADVGTPPLDPPQGSGDVLPGDGGDIPEPVGPMKPNDTYISNGYEYHTDDMGRIVSASGELHLSEERIRDVQAQLAAGGEDRLEGDDGGHLIATMFGGSPGLDNLVAENSFINRSQFLRLERSWAEDLAEGNQVFVDIQPYYGIDNQRPTAITGKYTVVRPDGASFQETFSLTNDDLRDEAYTMEVPYDDEYAEYNTYDTLSDEDRRIYAEAMMEKTPGLNEGRVFTYDEDFQAFSRMPEDSSQAFEQQRLIHIHKR